MSKLLNLVKANLQNLRNIKEISVLDIRPIAHLENKVSFWPHSSESEKEVITNISHLILNQTESSGKSYSTANFLFNLMEFLKVSFKYHISSFEMDNLFSSSVAKSLDETSNKICKVLDEAKNLLQELGNKKLTTIDLLLRVDGLLKSDREIDLIPFFINEHQDVNFILLYKKDSQNVIFILPLEVKDLRVNKNKNKLKIDLKCYELSLEDLERLRASTLQKNNLNLIGAQETNAARKLHTTLFSDFYDQRLELGSERLPNYDGMQNYEGILWTYIKFIVKLIINGKVALGLELPENPAVNNPSPIQHSIIYKIFKRWLDYFAILYLFKSNELKEDKKFLLQSIEDLASSLIKPLQLFWKRFLSKLLALA